MYGEFLLRLSLRRIKEGIVWMISLQSSTTGIAESSFERSRVSKAAGRPAAVSGLLGVEAELLLEGILKAGVGALGRAEGLLGMALLLPPMLGRLQSLFSCLVANGLVGKQPAEACFTSFYNCDAAEKNDTDCLKSHPRATT